MQTDNRLGWYMTSSSRLSRTRGSSALILGLVCLTTSLALAQSAADFTASARRDRRDHDGRPAERRSALGLGRGRLQIRDRSTHSERRSRARREENGRGSRHALHQSARERRRRHLIQMPMSSTSCSPLRRSPCCFTARPATASAPCLRCGRSSRAPTATKRST